VKTIGHEVIVQCRHTEKNHPNMRTIEVQRAYMLPADVDMATVTSHYDHTGRLKISASKKK